MVLTPILLRPPVLAAILAVSFFLYFTKVSCLVLFPSADVNVLSNGFRLNRFYLTCIFSPCRFDQLGASYWNNISCLQPRSLKNGELCSQRCSFAGSEVTTNTFAGYKFTTRSLILRHLKVLLYISIYMLTFSGAIWKRAKKKSVLNLFVFICAGVRKYFLHVSHELWLEWFI